MSKRGAQFALGGLFLAFLVAHVVCFSVAYLMGAIDVEDLSNMTVRILAIYSVPLGVVLGGVFGGTSLPTDRGEFGVLCFALVLSTLWNLLLVVRSVVFVISEGSPHAIAELFSYFDTLTAASTFLIGGALAYYSAK